MSRAGLPIDQVLREYSLLRSEARASDLFPDYSEYKAPTLSYETHPNCLNTVNYRPLEAVSEQCTQSAMQGDLRHTCSMMLIELLRIRTKRLIGLYFA